MLLGIVKNHAMTIHMYIFEFQNTKRIYRFDKNGSKISTIFYKFDMHIRRGTTHTLDFFNFGHNKLKYLKKTNKIISLHPCVRPSFFQLLITNQNQTG